MSDATFNPYHQWLGLERSVTRPNHYQLLGLDPTETNVQRIAEAANRALTRVRSCQPGPRGVEWAQVLEQVTAAASCLCDPARRAAYDRQMGSGGTAGRSFNRPAPRSRVVPAAGGGAPALPMQAPQRVPTLRPQGPSGAGGYGDPMASLPTAIPVAAVPGGGAVKPVPVATAPMPHRARSAASTSRSRANSSSLVFLAVAAGAVMMLLAGVILVIVMSRQTDNRNRLESRPVVRAAPTVVDRRPSPETSRKSAPRIRPNRSTEQKELRDLEPRSERGDEWPAAGTSEGVFPDLPASSVSPPPAPVESLTEPPSGPPGTAPPTISQPAEMPAFAPSPDAALTLPTFPAGPTLAPLDKPVAQPSLPEFKPALSDGELEPPQPTETMPAAADVKPEQVAALAKTLKAAHAAILAGNYEAALGELDKVASLPKLPEHHAKYERLMLLAGYAKNFQSALQSAIAGLQAGDEIEVGGSTVVGFVSAARGSITLRVTGANRTYALEKLPVGLAVALADRWLDKDDPVSLAVKGAYLASLKETTDERKARARQWLEEASQKGVEGELHKVLDDRYDLDATSQEK